MSPQLPSFIRALKRAGRAIPESGIGMEGNVGGLYNEYWSCSGIPGWLESPRGRWVDYQLTWYERRADRWTH